MMLILLRTLRRPVNVIVAWLNSIVARLKERPELPPERLLRSQYNAVWNRLSATEEQAEAAVLGNNYKARFQLATEESCRLLQETVGIKPDDVVLEIGAGVGRVGAAIAPLCREWIGTDVSNNMIGHMHRRLRHLSNIRLVKVNGYDLSPIASDSVDVVYCTVVYMHLEDWERYGYIAEGFRLLRPGGRMVVDNVSLLTEGGWNMFTELRAFPPEERPPQITRTSTPDEMAAYFRHAGFADIRQKQDDLWIVTHGIKPSRS